MSLCFLKILSFGDHEIQGESPKSLAIRFEKSNCIEYIHVVETDCKLPEFYKGISFVKKMFLIIFFFCNFFVDDEYPAHLAAYNGNLQLLSMLISEGHCHINQTDPLGCSPVHKGCFDGSFYCLM